MEKYINFGIPILLTLFAGLGWLYKHEKEKRLLIERQLSEKKYIVYYKFITIYFDIFKNVKKGKKFDANQFVDKMIEIKKELIIYGSDEVIKKFFKWEIFSHSGNKSLIPITDVIIEMRKDMGSPKTKISTKMFLRSIVNDEEAYQELLKDGIVI